MAQLASCGSVITCSCTHEEKQRSSRTLTNRSVDEMRRHRSNSNSTSPAEALNSLTTSERRLAPSRSVRELSSSGKTVKTSRRGHK